MNFFHDKASIRKKTTNESRIKWLFILFLIFISLSMGNGSAAGAISVVTDTTWKATNLALTGWQNLSFNDSAWGIAVEQTGGSWGPPTDHIPGTTGKYIWFPADVQSNTTDAYFRKVFFVAQGDLSSTAILSMFVDTDYEVYVNGTLVGVSADQTWQTAAEQYNVTAQLVVGQNIIAVHGINILGTPAAVLADLRPFVDPTPPAAGAVTAYDSEYSTFVDSPFNLTATFTDNESDLDSCEYCISTDGTCDTEWASAKLSGSSPAWTCTKTDINGTNGQLVTLNMRATSSGGTGTATPISRTIDAAPPSSGATFTAIPSEQQCILSWSAADDSGSGLHATEAYELRFKAGSDPGSCTGGSKAYIGTGLSFTHTGRTNGTTYYYRLCYKDNVVNRSEFSGNPVTCTPQSIPVSISGHVTTSGGAAISGVIMSGDSCSTTDGTGFYTCPVLSGWSGTITPSKSGLSFDPPSTNYRIITADLSGQDYTQIDVCGTVYVDPKGLCGGNVPCYGTVQEGIDSACDGAIIKVSYGTYNENIVIDESRGLTLQGGWNSAFTEFAQTPIFTILDGDVTGDGTGDGSVISLVAGTGVAIDAAIEGFTVTGGRNVSGGGIFAHAYSSGEISLLLNNSLVSNNTATSDGGGIYFVAENPGSALDAALINNLIVSNSSGSDGGGIYALASASGNAQSELLNNTISKNTAAGTGGGLRADSDTSGVNTITLKNNIVWGNTAPIGADIGTTQSGGTTTVSASFSDISVVFFDPSTYTADPSNINANPLFVNAASGNYHLSSTSVCIDGGTDAGGPPADYEGGIRPVDGDGDTVARTDIGADEYEVAPLLSVFRTGSGSGTVTDSVAGLDCGSNCARTYSFGTKVTKVSLKAIPDVGSTFKGWSGDCSGTKKCSLSMDSNKSVVAEFAWPDLTGSFVSAVSSFKKTSYQIALQLAVTPGDANAVNVTANVYLSADAFLDPGDLLLTPAPLSIGTLKADKVKQQKLKITSLVNPSGQYLITVIDPDNTVVETDESNNIVAGLIP